MDDKSTKEKKKLLKRFGQHLKKVREKKGMSGAELGRQTFIDQPHIVRLEQGRTNPTFYTITLLCQALEISVEEFFKGFDSEE